MRVDDGSSAAVGGAVPDGDAVLRLFESFYGLPKGARVVLKCKIAQDHRPGGTAG
jgi:hypothetical protein